MDSVTQSLVTSLISARDATIVQLTAMIAEKTAILAELAALSSAQQDIASVSSGASTGSESYQRETLSSKIKTLADTESLLIANIEQLNLQIAKVEPGFSYVAINANMWSK